MCNCPSWNPCDDCIVEFVKDWEDGQPIAFPDDPYWRGK